MWLLPSAVPQSLSGPSTDTTHYNEHIQMHFWLPKKRNRRKEYGSLKRMTTWSNQTLPHYCLLLPCCVRIEFEWRKLWQVELSVFQKAAQSMSNLVNACAKQIWRCVPSRNMFLQVHKVWAICLHYLHCAHYTLTHWPFLSLTAHIVRFSALLLSELCYLYLCGYFSVCRYCACPAETEQDT